MTHHTPRSRRPFRTVAAVVVSAALTGAMLGACSGKGDSATTTKPGASTTQPKTVSDTKIPAGKADDGFVGARADVTDLDCRPGPTESVATGKVTNPTDKKANYRIYAAFTGEGNRAAGIKEVEVTGLKPKESKNWEAKIAVGGEDLKCVVRAERTEAK